MEIEQEKRMESKRLMLKNQYLKHRSQQSFENKRYKAPDEERIGSAIESFAQSECYTIFNDSSIGMSHINTASNINIQGYIDSYNQIELDSFSKMPKVNFKLPEIPNNDAYSRFENQKIKEVDLAHKREENYS